MKTILFSLNLLLCNLVFGQSAKPAVFYCIDHPGKTLFYNNGQAVMKKGLQHTEHYQYGFMKWKGWINRTWTGLEYDLRFLPASKANQTGAQLSDSLINHFKRKGYTVQQVPMPYPMKPFAGYKKDGTNG